MPEGLKLTSICNRSAVPLLNQPQLIYTLTELSLSEQAAGVRLPLNFALVLDQSGSMGGEKIRTMRDAVKNIIDQLEPQDVVSVISFESKAYTLVSAQPAVNKDALKRQVDRIREGGGTNLAPALQEALKLVSSQAGPERVSRIVILTDGEVTDKEELSQQLAEQAGNQGIPIIGLGFGRDWNEDFLFDLADRSLLAQPGSRVGLADYIPTPNEIGRIFQEVYQSMQVIAQDVTLTLRMVQGLEARRIWQVAPLIKDIGRSAIQGRAIVIPVGELEKTGVAYLAEIMLPPRPEGAVRIIQTDVTYSMPGRGSLREATDVIIHYTPEPTHYQQMDGRVMNIVEKVQAFKLQTQALDEAEVGNVGGATQKLRQAVTILLSQGETELASQIQQEAEHLEASGQLSSEGKKTIKLTSRKTIKIEE